MIDNIEVTYGYKGKVDFDELRMITSISPINRTGFPHQRIWNLNRDFYLDLTIIEGKYCILKGSIRKWFFGKDTLKDLTYTDLEICLRKIATILHIDYKSFLNSSIRKLEFGKNIWVSFEPDMILGSLLRHPRLKKISTWPDSKKFIGDDLQLIFYNKLKEMKKKGITMSKVPWDKKNLHLLRYEIRMKNTVLLNIENSVNISHFDEKKIRITELKDLLTHYDILLKQWRMRYLEISKIVSKEREKILSTTYDVTKRMKRDIMLFGVHSLGNDMILNLINNSIISNVAKSRLRKEMFEKISVENASIIIECNRKITGEYWKEMLIFRRSYNKLLQVQ